MSGEAEAKGESIRRPSVRSEGALLTAGLATHLNLCAVHVTTVLEKQAVAKAEAGDHDEALALFERAAEACPESGSVMNNTAQLHRLKGDADSARSAVDRAVELELAWVAAHEATDRIALTGTWKVHKTTLQKALTQRAVMRRESGDTDGADADMAAAAAHGSALARAITTGTNPYATMCHAAVSTMMGPKEGEGAAE